MAGQLTWRNVDAPNFSNSLDGYRLASQLLGNAVDSARGMVGGYTAANAQAADRAILNRALGIQDSAAFQAGLADGSIVGPDLANASLDTLRGLDGRVSTLLNRDVTRQGFEQTGYENARGRETNALTDAAASDIAQARLFARTNDQSSLNNLLASSPTLRALRPNQLADLMTGADNLASSNQTRRSNDASFSRGQYEFGRQVQDNADSDAAQAALLGVLRSSGSTSQAQAAVEGMADRLSPGALSRVISGAGRAGYPLYGPVIGGSGSSGGSGRGSNALSVMTGGAALPDTVKTLGDFVSGKSSLLKGNPQGTATGLYQITADTVADFGPRVLGSDWRNADIRDPQVQDRLAEGIWNTVRDNPTAMRGRWASLSPAEAEQLKGSTWSAVRDTLSQKESGSRATEILEQAANRVSNNLGGNTASQLIAERAGQNQAVGIFPELNQLQSSRITAAEAVTNLVKDGPLAGSDRGEVLDQINWIVRNSRNRINPAMAAEMISRNVESNNNPVYQGISRLGNLLGRVIDNRIPMTSNSSDGVRIDNEGVQRMMQDYLNGSTSTQAQAQMTLGASNELVQAAQAAYNSADSEYRAMVNAAKTRPGLQGTLAEYKQRRDDAEQALRQVSQSVVNNDTLTPRFDRPVARTTGS